MQGHLLSAAGHNTWVLAQLLRSSFFQGDCICHHDYPGQNGNKKLLWFFFNNTLVLWFSQAMFSVQTSKPFSCGFLWQNQVPPPPLCKGNNPESVKALAVYHALSTVVLVVSYAFVCIKYAKTLDVLLFVYFDGVTAIFLSFIFVSWFTTSKSAKIDSIIWANDTKL